MTPHRKHNAILLGAMFAATAPYEGKATLDEAADNPNAHVVRVAGRSVVRYCCPACKSGVPFFVRDEGLVARRLPCECGARTQFISVESATPGYLAAYATGMVPTEPKREYYKPALWEMDLWNYGAPQRHSVAAGSLLIRTVGTCTCRQCGSCVPVSATANEVCDKCRDGNMRKLSALEQPPAAPGRNDPCPCGSGKKFKRCCIA